MIKITYFNQDCIKGHLYLTNLCFHKDDLFFPFDEKYKLFVPVYKGQLLIKGCHDITEILLKVALNTIALSFIMDSYLSGFNRCPYIQVWQHLTFYASFIVFNATFSNILAISWRPVLVAEEAGVLGENQRPLASSW